MLEGTASLSHTRFAIHASSYRGLCDAVRPQAVLSKMSAAKELMREFLEREKRKQAERAAEKEAKASAPAQPAPATP